MKTFNVTLYYHGSLEVEVQANNEEEAVVKARAEAEKLSSEDFIHAAGITEDEHDIDEIPPIKLSERWWGQTPFRRMEQMTGLREDDYPEGDDGNQAFVDACDEWWNSHSDEEKIEIWNANKDWN